MRGADHSRPQQPTVGKAPREQLRIKGGFWGLFLGLFLRAALQNVEPLEDLASPKHVVENMKSKHVSHPFLECCDHDSMQVLEHFPTICSLC